MIPVHLTCESEEIVAEEREADGLRNRPVIKLNGELVCTSDDVKLKKGYIGLQGEGGQLAEGEQSRHVGKTQLAPRHPAFNLFELGEPVEDDAGHGLVSLRVERQVSAGNRPDRVEP